MIRRALFGFALPAGLLLAQQTHTEPRSKAEDYPAHSTLASFEIGAEYMVHSVPVSKGMYLAKDYLVVEVAIFPSKPGHIPLSRGQFTLRINNDEKSDLRTQPPAMIASSIRIPDYDGTSRHIEGVAGVGDGSIIVGQPRPASRFPGDPTPQTTNIPIPSREGDPEDPTDSGPPVSVDEAVARASLAEATVSQHVKGCLFFLYRGKLKSIHSLDLLYDGGEGGEKAKLSIR
jgi:hypothetical protein